MREISPNCISMFSVTQLRSISHLNSLYMNKVFSIKRAYYPTLYCFDSLRALQMDD